MWSERPSLASRHGLAERLRTVLPAPRHQARNCVEPVPCDWEPAHFAEACWADSDFLWLDRPEHSLIGRDPIARLTVRAGSAVAEGPCGRLEIEARGFDLLEAALDAWGGPSGARLCGFLGYDLGLELEGMPHFELQSGDPPDLYLGLYDWRFEHDANGWRMCGTDAWRVGPGLLPCRRASARRAAPKRGSRPEGLPHTITSTPTPDGFRAAVARTVERICNGELFQVNLCRRIETALPAEEIWPLYTRLRAISPAAHGALIRTGPGSAVLSVSPELFLSVRDGVVRSCPIKGTRPRGRTPEEDQAFAVALQASEKDRAELAMIVDVTRNDLGRVCRAGSVAVTRHAELMTLPTVHHTFSEVTGRLRNEGGPADLLRASFPPASITGAPKIRAMEVATLEEGFRRGPAMGSIGWIALDGDMELSVAIRTAVAAEGRILYLAGCGITAGSNPEEELAESEAKASAFLRALGIGAGV